ncbi:MAG: RNase adapter RapZ [Hahellaceae bacterium]|nr:RNase adapter RapZ [Hahellaceae bacterium]MCP5169033.1 RNase adapter RapZ [Hahellaceae bacterium]
MKLIIVSGRSGSGKSTALHVLEDLGFYCIDNLPIGLLMPLSAEAICTHERRLEKIAVSIDARNLASGIGKFAQIYDNLRHLAVELDVIYLDALNQTLLKRFHATRRKHPLSDNSVSLQEAIAAEKDLLEPIASRADLVIDTSALTMYQLRDLIKERVAGRKGQDMAMLFQSFGFKHGVPIDADFVFDVRCLPNPFWDPALRGFTGLDQPVIDFLEKQPDTLKMMQDITTFLEQWLPRFSDSNRSYLTVGIGCTGGQHRSVYIAHSLWKYFSQKLANVQIRHKELGVAQSEPSH